MSQKISTVYRKKALVINFAIYCALVFLAFLPFLADCFNLPKFVVLIVGLVLFLCGFIMKFLNMRFITIYKNPLYLPLALFIFWRLISILFTTNKIAGISEIGLFISCSVLVFLVPLILRKADDVVLFFKILIVGSVVMSLYGIVQHFGFDFFHWNIKHSALSTFGRRNFAGEYLVFILPWALFIFLTEKKLQKLFYVLAFVLLMFHLFLTFTRASWIGFGVSMLLIALLLLRFDLKPALLKVVLVFLIFCLVFRVYGSIFQFEQGTLKSRILIWKTCIELIKERPIIGHGIGNFEPSYYKIAYEKENVLIPPNLRVDKAHNEFLEIAVENGIVGLLLFLFFIFTIYKMSWYILRNKNEKSFEKFVSVFAISGITGMLVNSLASFPLQTTAGCFFFFLNCGILSRMYFTVIEQKTFEKNFSYPGMVFLCMAGICAVIVFSFCALYSSYSLEKSKRIMRAVVKSGDPVLWLIAEMYGKNATSYNPFNVENYFHLGKLYLVGGQFDKAYENFMKALKFNPYSEQVLLNLGMVEQRRKNFAASERYFLKAYKVSRDNPEILKSLGLFYLETNEIEKAIYYLTQAQRFLSQDSTILTALAKAYENSGNRKKAQEILEQIPSEKPAAGN
ncbi:MAG: O-antigen ligase family protein [Candidatus Omnitrophica bacterium]|nr:O-antigen ligase family protein [Candidatus Omnitrophota bacterium]